MLPFNAWQKLIKLIGESTDPVEDTEDQAPNQSNKMVLEIDIYYVCLVLLFNCAVGVISKECRLFSYIVR